MKELTDKQKEILIYMFKFFATEQQIPTLRMISKEFGHSSHSASFGHLKAMKDKGYLELNILSNYKFTNKTKVLMARLEVL